MVFTFLNKLDAWRRETLISLDGDEKMSKDDLRLVEIGRVR